ncbi:hypothetical protein TH1_043 [Shewanella phage Thanatos-1]|nr:hypothetical protein TH1_043 [Shewanella phage Thanatos-1]
MKTLIAIVLCVILSLTVFSGLIASKDESFIIAAKYCTTLECIDILTLELDEWYDYGVLQSKNADMVTAFSRAGSDVQNMCNKAPNYNICLHYSKDLLEQFSKGYYSSLEK